MKQDVEPPNNIESSLLYIREDKTQEFVHDTYKEFFLAKWFADRIDDGRLSVRDAYEQFWSFEVDEESFGIGGRSVLPAWKPPIKFLSEWINKALARELADVLTTNYFEAKKKIKPYEVNPFVRNIMFFAECCNSLQIEDKELKETTLMCLIDNYKDYRGPVTNALLAMDMELLCDKLEDLPLEFLMDYLGDLLDSGIVTKGWFMRNTYSFFSAGLRYDSSAKESIRKVLLESEKLSRFKITSRPRDLDIGYRGTVFLDELTNREVIERFAHSKGEEAKEAAFAIINRGLKEAEPVCLQKIQDDSYDDELFYAIEVLADIGSTRAVPYLRCFMHRGHKKQPDSLHYDARDAILKILERNTPQGYNPLTKK